MNLDELQRKLIAAARENPPSDGVPYAFERRIMARLVTPALVDHWAHWARALWRGAAACVTITLIFSAWSYYSSNPSSNATDLTQQFENTLIAAADQDPSAETVQ